MRRIMAVPENPHTVQIRVTYADTDQMGVAYYSNYLIWFEIARTEFFRASGLIYKQIEDEENIYLPVVESHCVYKAPVKYDDLITIKTRVSEIGRCRLTFEYEIMNDGRSATTGYTKHVFINADRKPVEIPPRIREAFAKPG